MIIKGPLIPGVFIERPNRFITLVEVNGKIVRSHLPDPGRLKELLIPGTEVLLKPATNLDSRKTKFSTVMVRFEGRLISLVSALPNKFVKESIEKNILPMLKNYKIIRPEVPYGNHRFDFLLNNHEGFKFYLEVKSVTYVKNGIARFPDAITARGTRHVVALSELMQSGINSGILFVCQRDDPASFEPMWDRDPIFSKALFEASKMNVNIWCISTTVTETEITFKRQIPVNLTPPKSG